MNIILKRVLGFILDLMLIALVTIISHFIFSNINENIPVYIGFILVLLRDIFTKNGSIGKKITRIKLVNNQKQNTSLIQKILRNITIFLWPLEGIILLISKKRIGDILFKTDVIEAGSWDG